MTKSTITRESLEQLADNNTIYKVSWDERIELAQIALAAMDSEPVAWMHNNNDIGIPAITTSQKIGQYWIAEFKDVQPLYRHPQPAPVVPAVSDDIGEIRLGRLPTMNQDDYPGLGDWWVQLRIGEDSDEVLARVYGATPQEANNRAEALACRAAMLSGGRP
ncbi:hypothetical protein [Klebsiella quasipneumoniae]|uniref:hypothetical protein n=1 Tax=Klebsiella quasipneumoniae TaxID=1463165 RepID=UPI001495BF5E|nr:hypothetical protein [Klebsiella quasipneumoniae]